VTSVGGVSDVSAEAFGDGSDEAPTLRSASAGTDTAISENFARALAAPDLPSDRGHDMGEHCLAHTASVQPRSDECSHDG